MPSPTLTVSPSPGSKATATNALPVVYFGEIAFDAELAVTASERSKGLSDRDSLPPRTGMLFTFGNGRASNFWMFGMRFPLDLIWISRNCTVVDITSQVRAPEPDAPASQLEFYNPSSPASHTFEINAGEAEIYGITVGTLVRFVGVSAESDAACE